MTIYVNERNEIKDVNFTSDTSLIEIEVTDGTFDGWSIAKILCYKVNVVDGNVVMLTPYLDSRIVEHIDKLGQQTESIIPDMKLDAVLLQAKMVAENNTDEQALKVKTLYENWEDYADGDTLTQGSRLNYDGDLYKVLQTHNKQEAWTPKDAPSLFAKVLIPDPEVIPDWEQPSSTNPYMKGDKVKHNGYKWKSLIDYNVYEPSDTLTTIWENLGEV